MIREVLEAILAPIAAAVKPGEYFEWLRAEARRLPLLAKAALALGAWVGASMITFMLALLVGVIRGVVHADIAGVIGAPGKAAVVAVLLPILAAGVDSILIMVGALPAPREESLLLVPLVRASSLLPYTVRAAILSVVGEASLRSLYAASLHPLDLALLLAGTSLTAYGLRKTLVMPAVWAAIAALIPLAVKVYLGLG